MNITFFANALRRSFFAVAFVISLAGGQLGAEETPTPNVRIAELEIDPAQIEEYTLALKEEIESSLRLEPGVLALNAVAEKEHPARIRILEIYASEAAYQAHIETPHFKKYKDSTRQMVKSLKLIEVVPVYLGTKTR